MYSGIIDYHKIRMCWATVTGKVSHTWQRMQRTRKEKKQDLWHPLNSRQHVQDDNVRSLVYCRIKTGGKNLIPPTATGKSVSVCCWLSCFPLSIWDDYGSFQCKSLDFIGKQLSTRKRQEVYSYIGLKLEMLSLFAMYHCQCTVSELLWYWRKPKKTPWWISGRFRSYIHLLFPTFDTNCVNQAQEF